jgi:hypothetical protein
MRGGVAQKFVAWPLFWVTTRGQLWATLRTIINQTRHHRLKWVITMVGPRPTLGARGGHPSRLTATDTHRSRVMDTNACWDRGERQMERPIPGKAGAMRKFG